MYICKLTCVFVLSMCILTRNNKVFINDESVDQSFGCSAVSEVWNMGYSAPWTLLNNLFSSPGW